MTHYFIKAQDQGYSTVDLQKLADYINGLGRITITRMVEDGQDVVGTIELVEDVQVEGTSLAVDTI